MMAAKQERFTPKRREIDPVRRNKKGQCVGCKNFETTDNGPCIWKIEAQLDKAFQHINIALSLMRKMTATQRQLYRNIELQTVVTDSTEKSK